MTAYEFSKKLQQSNFDLTGIELDPEYSKFFAHGSKSDIDRLHEFLRFKRFSFRKSAKSKMADGGTIEMDEFYLYDENGKKYEFYKKEGDNYMFSSYKVPFGKALTIEKSELQEKIKDGKYKVVASHAKGGEITREDITILGVPRSKITDKEWESIIRMSKYQKGATFILKDEKGLDVKPQIEYDWYVNEKMADGGKVKFADKVKSVQESLLKRKKVSPKVQKDYGKTYSKAEAKESAQRIVGSRMAQLKEKMAKKKK
jgi:hypothetical protein